MGVKDKTFLKFYHNWLNKRTFHQTLIYVNKGSSGKLDNKQGKEKNQN